MGRGAQAAASDLDVSKGENIMRGIDYSGRRIEELLEEASFCVEQSAPVLAQELREAVDEIRYRRDVETLDRAGLIPEGAPCTSH